jgi:hypothetical protein
MPISKHVRIVTVGVTALVLGLLYYTIGQRVSNNQMIVILVVCVLIISAFEGFVTRKR